MDHFFDGFQQVGEVRVLWFRAFIKHTDKWWLATDSKGSGYLDLTASFDLGGRDPSSTGTARRRYPALERTSSIGESGAR